MNFNKYRLLGSISLVAVLAILIGSSTGFAQNTFTISGSIRDSVSGEELIGVSIYDLNSYQGVSTNVYGFYSLTLPAGKHSLVYSYLLKGRNPQVSKLMALCEALQFNFFDSYIRQLPEHLRSTTETRQLQEQLEQMQQEKNDLLQKLETSERERELLLSLLQVQRK